MYSSLAFFACRLRSSGAERSRAARTAGCWRTAHGLAASFGRVSILTLLADAGINHDIAAADA